MRFNVMITSNYLKVMGNFRSEMLWPRR